MSGVGSSPLVVDIFASRWLRFLEKLFKQRAFSCALNQIGLDCFGVWLEGDCSLGLRLHALWLARWCRLGTDMLAVQLLPGGWWFVWGWDIAGKII